MKRIILPLLTLAISSVALTASAQSADPEAESRAKLAAETNVLNPGDPAADFTAERYYDATPVQFSQYRGRVVLLTFWGSWCAPCRRELAPGHLPALLDEFAANDRFAFLPVAQDSREALDEFFASEMGQNYLWLKPLTLLDPERANFKLFATAGIPRSILINAAGYIDQVFIGSYETPEQLDILRQAIKTALASPTL